MSNDMSCEIDKRLQLIWRYEDLEREGKKKRGGERGRERERGGRGERKGERRKEKKKNTIKSGNSVTQQCPKPS